MNKSELMKTANEIRKSIVTAVHTLPNPDIRADLCQQQTLHIFIF